MGIPSECPLCHRRLCDHTAEERGQSYEEMMGDVPIKPRAMHHVPASCGGEKCMVVKDWHASPPRRCGKPAAHKLEETIFDDDPMPIRHPLVSYVCCSCFMGIVGPAAGCPVNADV